MDFIPFDPKYRQFKSVYGAAYDGQSVTLRVLLHKDAQPSGVFLKIRPDGGYAEYLQMPFIEKCNDDYNWYGINYTAREGLYFYSFCYDSPWGRLNITRFKCGEGLVSDEGGEWQLTVTDKDYETPSDIAGGIIYQIFPDRFYKSGKEHPDVPADRFLQDDWYARPEHRQIPEKKTLGNDYFGGDLAGITEKLPYIKNLGVSIIYLNPIFEAHSNHRYNTADYMKIDPLLGNEEDLKTLCKKAEKLGIKIILDGVFSHTGDDSIYFNKYNRYQSIGAFNSEFSRYRTWYNFTEWPNKYHAWWGVPSLPELNENNREYTEFICGKNGVLRHWLKCGISGWRLDVADELPDEFLDNVRKAVKAENPNALIIGEVWEDATNKFSYGCRRRYLRGKQLDSVMNYPFASAIMAFIRGGNSSEFLNSVFSICDNYPKKCLDILMNHIGTHDTMRAISALVAEEPMGRGRDWQAEQKLLPEQLRRGVVLLKLAAALQYTLPGIPSLYYGDEAGLSGYGDPFCRAAYPWGKENAELLEFYQKLGKIRRDCSALNDGELIPLDSGFGLVCYKRVSENSELLIAVNRWRESDSVYVGEEWNTAEIKHGVSPKDGILTVPPEDFVILTREK